MVKTKEPGNELKKGVWERDCKEKGINRTKGLRGGGRAQINHR